MDRWQNRVCVITGAATGIGASIVRDLLNRITGIKVVGLDINLERMEKLRSALPSNLQSHFTPMKCDLLVEKEILSVFQLIEKNLGGVDILINNVGMGKLGQNLCTMDTKLVREIMDLNVMATVICNREAVKSMKARKVDGQIILMNGIQGHVVAFPNDMSTNIYSPTKHALTAMTEVLRQELINMGLRIKVTSLSPGLVNTDFIQDLLKVNNKVPTLRAEDVADAVMYIIGTPVNVHIQELMIRPVGETLLN